MMKPTDLVNLIYTFMLRWQTKFSEIDRCLPTNRITRARDVQAYIVRNHVCLVKRRKSY